MDARRIAELLEPFLGAQDPRPNTQDLLPSISTYIDLLIRWNTRINLTAIRDPEQIVTRHFGESLFAARHLFPNRTAVHTRPLSSRPECVGERSDPAHAVEGPCGVVAPETSAAQRRQTAARPERSRTDVSRGSSYLNGQAPDGRKKLSLADIGSGPGFPGLPIKLWAPDISLTLIESNHKKATFLREVVRALTLTDINIQTARAESLAPGSFDVVTLRAVEHFAAVLPAAAALLRPQGRLALLIGSAQTTQAKSVLPTLTWAHSHPIPLSNTRVLLIGQHNDLGRIYTRNPTSNY